METIFYPNRPEINAGVPGALKPKRSAYVFITAESNSSLYALEDLRRLDVVQEAYLARGAYDIVAKVTGDSLENIREDAVKRIQNLNTVKSILTLTIV